MSSLPAPAAAVAPPAVAPPTDGPTDPDRALLAGLTVLYVEDHDESREQLGRYLGHRFGRVLLASTGAEGLRSFRAERPSIVITDLMLPDSNGLAFVEEIRREDAAVPIIVTSRVELASWFQRALDAGVDAYVTKPVDVARLEQALARCARRLRAAGALAAQASTREKAGSPEAEFLAVMSHEIRTPMAGVLGMAELLLGTSLTDEQRDLVESINRCGDSLLTILNDVLDLSKLDAGKLSFEAIPFDLSALLADVVAIHQAKRATEAVELLIDVDACVPALLVGDPCRLRQLVGNLLSNAMKFTSEGHVLVSVSAGPPAPGAGSVRLMLSVADTGIGISREAQGRLFEPFAQEDATTARRFGGTGLGLLLCKRIADGMGGSLSVKSEAGCGATFTLLLELPIAREQPTALASASSLRGARALIVSNGVLTRWLMGKQLRRMGVEAIEVSSAAEAIERLSRPGKERPFELVLVDQRMAITDGEVLGRALRADPARAALGLVLLTTAGIGGDAARIEAAGFDACLPRPVGTGLLIRTLAAVLDRKRRGVGGPILTRHGVGARPPSGNLPTLRLASRVLIAEDNEVNQKVARRLLERAGAKVTVAGDGASAVAAFERQTFDLILMDCKMPGTDGFAATALIRKLEQQRGGRVPIVAMTASALSGDRARCLAAGMDDYLSKPVTREKLLAAVLRWSGANAVPRAPAAQTWPDLMAMPVAWPAAEVPLDEPRMDLPRFREVAELVSETPGEFYGSILPRWLRTVQEQSDGLVRALKEREPARVRELAHALHGGAKNLGFTGLGEQAAEIEALASREPAGDIPAHLPALLAELAKVAAFAKRAG